MFSVVVAEQNPIFALGLQAIFERIGCRVVAQCGSACSISSVITSHSPDFLCVGPQFCVGEGYSFLNCVRVELPEVRIIVALDIVGPIERSLLASCPAIGLVRVDAGQSQYQACVRILAEGGSWIDPSLLKSPPEEPQPAPTLLTSREREIASMVKLGLRNKQIANELRVSEGTVKMHLHHIFAKFRISTRTQLAMATA